MCIYVNIINGLVVFGTHLGSVVEDHLKVGFGSVFHQHTLGPRRVQRHFGGL